MLDLGYDAETINYLPDEVAKPWTPSIISKIGPVQYFLRLGYFLTFIIPRQKNFLHFRSLMNISRIKYTDKTFAKINDKYDIIMIGGDQLWNCKLNYFNVNNFLPFIQEKNRKVVYAASLAQDNMRKGFEAEFQTLAEGFGYVTTREQRGTEIIESLTSLTAPRVADPAFLLTVNEWAALAEEDAYIKYNKYVFVYQVQSDAVVSSLAQKIAKEKNLKIIYCPFPLKKPIKCKSRPYMSPEQWLGYIKNAEYVVTDAFHGLVFSIIFNKKFCVEISEYGKDTHTRITNLLELLGLSNRLFLDGNYSRFDEEIDYASINQFIKDDCTRSIQHLHAMLNL